MSANRGNDGKRQTGLMLVFEEMSPASPLSPSFRMNAKRFGGRHRGPHTIGLMAFLKSLASKTLLLQ